MNYLVFGNNSVFGINITVISFQGLFTVHTSFHQEEACLDGIPQSQNRGRCSFLLVSFNSQIL